ncbi:TraR/DksA C4-type zinc finger protein [Streptomyces sp. NPDC048242]
MTDWTAEVRDRRPIPPERLAIRPAATMCVGCAEGARRR